MTTTDNSTARIAFENTARAELDALYRTALRMLRNTDEAEDAVQEALAKAWRNVAQLHDETQVRPWLFKILVNTCLDHIRVRARKQNALQETNDDRLQDIHPVQRLPDDLLHSKELGNLIDTEIARLTEQQQAVVQLIIVEQFSYNQAAEILDLPIGTVRSRLSRARSQLMTALATLLEQNHGHVDSEGTPRLRLVK